MIFFFLLLMGVTLKTVLYVFRKCVIRQQLNTNNASVKPYLISTFRVPNLPLSTPLQYPLFGNLFISPAYEMHSKQKHHN